MAKKNVNTVKKDVEKTNKPKTEVCKVVYYNSITHFISCQGKKTLYQFIAKDYDGSGFYEVKL